VKGSQKRSKWKNRSNQSGTASRKKQKTTANSSPAAAAQLVVTANGEESQAAMPTVDSLQERRRKTNYDNVPALKHWIICWQRRKRLTKRRI
jgi:hypothetical protein